MTWIQFFTWSMIFYVLYYGFNILVDSRKGMRTNSEVGAEDVLHFTESQPPVKVKVVKAPVKQKEPKQPISNEEKKIITEADVAHNTETIKKAIEANGVDLKGLVALALKGSVKTRGKVDFSE